MIPRTYREVLSELPDGIREAAIRNTDSSIQTQVCMPANKEWMATIHGTLYWLNVYKAAASGRPYPALPITTEEKEA